MTQPLDALTRYRLERAQESLDAHILADAERWHTCVIRPRPEFHTFTPFPYRYAKTFFPKPDTKGMGIPPEEQPMFCIIYTFTVKPSCEDQFCQSWSAVTHWFYQYAGSLGSRLHRTSTGAYIAYAQWQTRAQWEQQTARADAELQRHRQAMRQVCEAIEVLYELDVVDDRLRGEVYGCGDRGESD